MSLNFLNISSRYILPVEHLSLTPFRDEHFLVKRALGFKPSSALWPWASYLIFLGLSKKNNLFSTIQCSGKNQWDNVYKNIWWPMFCLETYRHVHCIIMHKVKDTSQFCSSFSNMSQMNDPTIFHFFSCMICLLSFKWFIALSLGLICIIVLFLQENISTLFCLKKYL